MVWATSGDIKARYVASDGTFSVGPMAIGPEGPTDDAFVVNLASGGAQSTPVVAMNADLALAAWSDPGGAGRDDADRTIRMRVLTEPAP